MSNDLIILKNSSYARGRKYIVDAEEIMYNLRTILESAGTGSVTEIIEATGQVYNPLITTQLLNGITQLILASNYFKDIGTQNDIILDAYTPGYGVPTQYIHNMTVKFRPSISNTGATTISFRGLSSTKPLLTDTYSPLSSGSLLPTLDYSATYNEDYDAFILSSTIEDSGSIAMQEIRNLVESAGLTFSVALEQQLAQAVAIYSLQQTYECVSTGSDIPINNYVLRPINSFFQIPSYTNGMVIRFRPTFSNSLPNPTVQIYGMTRCPLLYADGDSIPVDSITNFYDVVVKYDNGSFYLVSNGLSSLKLQDGPVVTSISNDTSLANQSPSSVPTEFAVKSYVDAKSNATRAYAVSSGRADSYGRADFFSIDPDNSSVLNILAGTVGQPSYETMVSLSNAEASPNKAPTFDPDEEEYIYYTLANCFDGNNETYYETEDTGSDVQGQPDPMHEGEYIVMPNFVGATGLVRDISKVRLLANDASTMPTSVFFQYSVDGGTTWQDVGTEIYEEVDGGGIIHQKVRRDIYYLDINSGQYTDVDVEIFPYADNAHPEYGLQYPYDVRCYAYEFTNANSGWQLVNYQFCYASEEIPPLVVTFADGTSRVTNDKTTLSVSGYNGTLTVVENQGGAFELVEPGLYVESYTQPTVVDGLHWVKIGGNTITTYLYTENIDTSVIEESEVNYVKIGTVDVLNGDITGIHPAAFNGSYQEANITLDNPTVITHNINSLNSAKFFLTCVGADGGYVDGDTVELTTQAVDVDISSMATVSTQLTGTSLTFAPITIGGVDYNISFSPDPHTHTATSTVSNTSAFVPTYRVVSSGLTSALLRYNAIVLPNKNTGSLFTINANAWRLSIVCTRSF